MDNVAYIVTFATIIGTIANSYQKSWCFIIWSFTNLFWTIYNILNKQYAQALLYLFNLIMSIVGLWQWNKKAKKGKDNETVRKR